MLYIKYLKKKKKYLKKKKKKKPTLKHWGNIVIYCVLHTILIFSLLYLCISLMLQSFHLTHAKLSSCTDKSVFSRMFCLNWIELQQGMSCYHNIFLNKSDQLFINII